MKRDPEKITTPLSFRVLVFRRKSIFCENTSQIRTSLPWLVCLVLYCAVQYSRYFFCFCPFFFLSFWSLPRWHDLPLSTSETDHFTVKHRTYSLWSSVPLSFTNYTFLLTSRPRRYTWVTLTLVSWKIEIASLLSQIYLRWTVVSKQSKPGPKPQYSNERTESITSLPPGKHGKLREVEGTVSKV